MHDIHFKYDKRDNISSNESIEKIGIDTTSLIPKRRIRQTDN